MQMAHSPLTFPFIGLRRVEYGMDVFESNALHISWWLTSTLHQVKTVKWKLSVAVRLNARRCGDEVGIEHTSIIHQMHRSLGLSCHQMSGFNVFKYDIQNIEEEKKNEV